MVATLHTKLFNQDYEIVMLVIYDENHNTKIQITMNDVPVDEKFVNPVKLRDPGKLLVDWLYSRYRGQFTSFAVEQ